MGLKEPEEPAEGRIAQGTGERARCDVNGASVRRVILDPGSSHLLFDRACIDRLKIPVGSTLPGIELANGQTAPVFA